MKVYIYIYTNIEEGHLEYGQSYVGISKDPENRFFGHIKASSLIGCKLRKHEFIFDILDAVNTYEKAYELEKFYIKELNTLWPKGYNLTEGGDGHTLWLESSKQKLRKPRSEETKQKISKSH